MKPKQLATLQQEQPDTWGMHIFKLIVDLLNGLYIAKELSS